MKSKLLAVLSGLVLAGCVSVFGSPDFEVTAIQPPSAGVHVIEGVTWTCTGKPWLPAGTKIPYRMVTAPGGNYNDYGFADFINKRIEINSRARADWQAKALRHEPYHFAGCSHK